MIPAIHMELFLKVHLTNHAPIQYFSVSNDEYTETAEWRNKCKEDHPSWRRDLCICEKKPWKNQIGQELNSDLCDTGAVLKNGRLTL